MAVKRYATLSSDVEYDDETRRLRRTIRETGRETTYEDADLELDPRPGHAYGGLLTVSYMQELRLGKPRRVAFQMPMAKEVE